MAEDIDSQLKTMAVDLKEIIEQMNAANSNQEQEQTTVSSGDRFISWAWLVGVVNG